MASYSSVPSVSEAISASTTSSATLYTVPANSYSMFNAYLTSSAGNSTITIGGRLVYSLAASGTVYLQGLIAGPGQAIAITIGTGQVDISGVTLTNGL